MPDVPSIPVPSGSRWSIDELLYSILSPNAELQELVPSRIGPVGAFGHEDAEDRLQYQQIGTTWDYDCDGRSLARARYQLTAWSRSHESASRIAAAVVGVLGGTSATAVLQAVFVEDQGDVFDLESDESFTWYGKYVVVTLIVKGY